jgi:hypothetical protein
MMMIWAWLVVLAAVVIAAWLPHYLKTTGMPLDAVRPQRHQGRQGEAVRGRIASYALAGI